MKLFFEIERFLPFVDNWATCDQLIVKTVKKNPEKILPKINVWIKSEKTFTVRFAIGLLMRYFLDENFDDKFLKQVAEVKSDEYYVNMMTLYRFLKKKFCHNGCIINLFKRRKKVLG